MRTILISALVLLGISCSGQGLRRKIFHGFEIAPLTVSEKKEMSYEGEGGIFVRAIHPSGSAFQAEVIAPCIVSAINGIVLSSPNDLNHPQLSNLREGDNITYTLFRNGATSEMSASAVGRPKEEGDSHATNYFSIPFDNGQLRAIANLPEGDGPFPTVFFIQGYTCSSVESPHWPGHPYRDLARQFTSNGIAFVRVEKPGIGDSEGTSHCMSTDFHYEVASFSEAAAHVKDMSFVDPSEFYLFGHSMGGYLAPIVAQSVETSGIAVYGTRHEPWREYFLQMWRFQLVRQGLDYVELEDRMDEYYELAYQLFLKKKSPEQIAEEHPELRNEMEEGLMWSGGDIILFRNYQALQSVDDLPVVRAWSEYEMPVLVFYGTSDFEVCSDESPREMVRLINQYHPSKGRYVELSGVDHSMFQVGDLEEALNRSREESMQIRASGIDPRIVEEVNNWIIDIKKQ